MQVAEELGTILQVPDKLDGAIAHEIVCGTVAEALNGTRADAAHREGTDAVGTAGIEHLAVGNPVAVAVMPDIACIDVTHKARRAVQPPRLGEVGFNLEEL